jgi:hypothetical protein
MLIPNFEIKSYSEEYKEQVRKIILKLDPFYPGIDKWFEKLIPKLSNGNSICLMVIDSKDKVQGVAVSGFENESIVKLKTFYLEPDFRSFSISVPLLKQTLNYWMEKRVRRIFVTFAEEELDELIGFFDKFGFLMEGMMPQQYREGKNEYIMGKTFVYDTLDESQFIEFVRHYLLSLHGIRPKQEGNEFIAEEDSSLSKTPRDVFVKIITTQNPDGNDLFDFMEKKITETNSTYGILVSYYPIPEESKNKRLKVIDGYLLENIFFSLELKRSGNAALILPIEEEYAIDLLNLHDFPQKSLGQQRVSITHERAYFTGKDNFQGVGRGCTLIFHQIHKGIVAEAKIKLLTVDTIDHTIKNYSHKGVLLEKSDMLPHSNRGMISTILFTNIRKYPEVILPSDVRAIKPDVNFTWQPLTQNELEQIRDLSGLNRFSY